MSDSRFWRVMAAAAVLGLFYLGHGLHQKPGDAASSLLPELTGKASANDVISIRVPTNAKEFSEAQAIVTKSPDGKTLYIFRWAVEDNKPVLSYFSTVSADRG